MEKGLKNLQSAVRTASRRERQHFDHSGFHDEIHENPFDPYREGSKSRLIDDDEFNDSAIGSVGAVSSVGTNDAIYPSNHYVNSALHLTSLNNTTQSGSHQVLPAFSSGFGMPSTSSAVTSQQTGARKTQDWQTSTAGMR